MNATVAQELSGYPIYQFHPSYTATCYPGQHTPYIQQPQIKEENQDGSKQGTIKREYPRKLTKDKVAVLCHEFEKNQYPNMEQRTELAAALGTTSKRIFNWFSNRRSTYKKKIDAMSTKDIKREPVTPTSSVTSFDFPTILQDYHPTSAGVEPETSKPDAVISMSLSSRLDSVSSLRTSIYDEFMPQYVWYTD